MIGIFLPPIAPLDTTFEANHRYTFQAQLSQTGGLDGHLADLDYQKKQTSRK
jgi:hypothetical protein